MRYINGLHYSLEVYLEYISIGNIATQVLMIIVKNIETVKTYISIPS